MGYCCIFSGTFPRAEVFFTAACEAFSIFHLRFLIELATGGAFEGYRFHLCLKIPMNLSDACIRHPRQQNIGVAPLASMMSASNVYFSWQFIHVFTTIVLSRFSVFRNKVSLLLVAIPDYHPRKLFCSYSLKF